MSLVIDAIGVTASAFLSMTTSPVSASSTSADDDLRWRSYEPCFACLAKRLRARVRRTARNGDDALERVEFPLHAANLL